MSITMEIINPEKPPYLWSDAELADFCEGHAYDENPSSNVMYAQREYAGRQERD